MTRPATAWKVLAAEELATLERDGRFGGSADDRRDGFIHLSTEAQLEGTLAKHFARAEGLQLVAVDLAAYGDTLRWERARDDEFPHLYGDLRLDTVIAYGPLERTEDGGIRLPVTG